MVMTENSPTSPDLDHENWGQEEDEEIILL